jgi:hypothetical protein
LINEENKVYYCGNSSAQYGGSNYNSETIPTYHGYNIGNFKRCDLERILTNEWNDNDVLILNYFNSSSSSFFTIPDRTTHISKSFFDNISYSTIYIPKSVQTIESNAFLNKYINVVFECEESEKPEGYPYGHSYKSSFTFGV